MLIGVEWGAHGWGRGVSKTTFFLRMRGQPLKTHMAGHSNELEWCWGPHRTYRTSGMQIKGWGWGIVEVGVGYEGPDFSGVFGAMHWEGLEEGRACSLC